MTKFELFSTVGIACSLVIAVISIVFTYVSLKNQKNQWLNDAFIKNEADVLLEFRIAYGESEEAISFFLHTLLEPLKIGYPSEESPTIKREIIVKNFNKINELNNLYNKNQYIFRKYDLEVSISCLTCILDVVRMLPENDLEFDLAKQDGSVKTYYLKEWNKVIQTFSYSAYFLFNQVTDVNALKEMQNKNMTEEFQRLKERVSSELNSLRFKLDQLTLYYDGKNKSNLNVRQSKYYMSLSK